MGDASRTVRALKPPAERLRIGIAIATTGRAEVLRKTVSFFASQIRPADAVIVCSPNDEDVDLLVDTYPEVIHRLGPRGLPHQRNRLLDLADNLDVLLFLDDDFLMAPDYIAETEAAFLDDPDVVMTTGAVVADGIIGPGLSFEEAQRQLSGDATAPAARMTPVYNGYGCNMAVRLAAVREHGLRFDEELPLYAWLEDVDFSRSIAPFGRIIRLGTARGVHLGVKSGRQRGIRLGYSQIANPCYLIAKGTCSWRKGLFHMSRNLAANVYGTLRGERTIDRPARLLGNLKAMGDLVTRRLAPSRALRL